MQFQKDEAIPLQYSTLSIDVRIPWLRAPLTGGYALAVLAAWVWIKPRHATRLTAVGFALVLLWWLTLQPSHDRDWQPDVAVLSYVDLNGNLATLHNIRHCDYRTADLYLVHWGSPYIAHTMVSFGFAGGNYVCFSIETRKERWESYSAIKCFFRQFELIYVAGDYSHELLYERGLIATHLPLAKSKERAHINALARAAGQSANFPQLIRPGVL